MEGCDVQRTFCDSFFPSTSIRGTPAPPLVFSPPATYRLLASLPCDAPEAYALSLPAILATSKNKRLNTGERRVGPR